jgi:50S ribosomal subunit-associated GTPase HflX
VADELLSQFGVPRERVLLAYNKADLVPHVASSGEDVRISALTGDGLSELRAALIARLEALGVRMPVYGAAPSQDSPGHRRSFSPS